MRKKRIFDNAVVTALLKKYVRRKKDLRLRNKIVKLALPLISAAISRHRTFRHRDDLKQECALKIIQAIPKYDSKRGDAFGFFWATICNMCKSQNERLSRPNLSISSDEDIRREAEISKKDVFQTPENQLILNSINRAVAQAFNGNGFRVPRRRLHKRACRFIQSSIASGEFFFNRNAVIHRLKRIGLAKKEILFYTQYTLVVAREKLLVARENSSAIGHPQISKNISPIADRGGT